MEGRGIAGRRHLEERGIEALEMEGAPARRPVAHDQVTPQLAYLVQGASEWGEWEGGRKGGRKGERAGGNMDARAIEGFIGATSAITANVQDLSSFLCPWAGPAARRVRPYRPGAQSHACSQSAHRCTPHLASRYDPRDWTEVGGDYRH